MSTFKNSRSYSVLVGGSFVVAPGEEIDLQTGEPVKPKPSKPKAETVTEIIEEKS